MTSAEVDVLREQVCALHAELVRYGLVAWTSGNVSARVPGAGLMVIKPSGVRYEDLTPASMVACGLDGEPVPGSGLRPSSDAAAHGYIYRHLPQVGGVVHTHSGYATAWAVRRPGSTSLVELDGPSHVRDVPRVRPDDQRTRVSRSPSTSSRSSASGCGPTPASRPGCSAPWPSAASTSP